MLAVIPTTFNSLNDAIYQRYPHSYSIINAGVVGLNPCELN